MGFVNLLDVPNGVGPKETERYLREHAAEICNYHDVQNGGGAAA
jgi:hypothetical protein